MENKKMVQQAHHPEQGRRVAIVIAFRDFRDPEYFIPKQVLKGAGVQITTVSTSLGTAIGADGGEVEVNLLLENLNPKEFDAIVFIGGPGCLKYLDNGKSYKVIQETISENKILGAICISPVILAKAGVLEGKKVTVWSSPLDKSSIKILEEKGATYQDEAVVVDGKVVTANGPVAAQEFGEALIEVLTP